MRRIKNFIRRHESLYNTAVFAKNFPREMRSFFLPLMKYNEADYAGSVAFQGDENLQAMAKKILAETPITAVVETGTYRGDTTVFLSDNFNGPIYTCENMGLYYREDKHRFTHYPRVTQLRGSSAESLQRLTASGELRDFPFFFLDAHWYDYWPLLDELAIVKQLGKAIIIIHDFAVPGKPHFGFDVYHKQKTGEDFNTDLDFIKGFLDPTRHKILFPNYGGPEDHLRGHIIIFQDAPEAFARVADPRFTEHKL